jgi:hypothetical protein
VPLTHRQAQLTKIAHRKHRLKSSFCEEYVVIVFKKENEKNVFYTVILSFTLTFYMFYLKENANENDDIFFIDISFFSAYQYVPT